MRRIVLLGALAGLAACPSGGADKQVNKPVNGDPSLPGNEIKFDLPEIPAKIEVAQSLPTDGHSPDQRSPVLDVLKAENDRQIAVLKQAPEPAYYLAYQVIEQGPEED